MAMQPGNVIPPEKMHFTAAGSGQWIPDERDGFISWLRSEFAAANAIIDSLCQHLRAVGDPCEYDAAIATIQQRRFNWTPVLHMQQYFSVADVSYMLQQIAWKKQQQQNQQQQHRGFVVDHQGKFGGKEFRKSGAAFNKHDRSEKPEEAKSGCVNVVKLMEDNRSDDDKRGSGVGAGAKPNAEAGLKSSGKSEVSAVGDAETQAGIANHECTSNLKDSDLASDQKQNPTGMPQTFVATETYSGKPVNVVEGLKLYREFLDGKEVSKLVSLVNDLRVSGKKGQLLGETYVVYKRPMKGHGREMIQLGLPIADAPLDDEITVGISKDRRVEPIPASLQDVIERLASMQIMPVKPDSCIVDFYNEGDHSQPYQFAPWFGRPICLMFLSECDMTFGRIIVSDHPGDYKGSLKLSLAPGSLLLMQGKSADFSRYAIPSTRKQRMIITFTKSLPKKSLPGLTQSSSLAPPTQWGPQTSRSPNHTRHTSGPAKHYTGVLPSPPPLLRPQIPPSNGIQPLFVPASVAPAMLFAAPPVPLPPDSAGWLAIAPPPSRHPPPRIPFPGTGVFLPPPGSGNLPNPEAGPAQEKENGSGKPWHGDDSAASEGKLDEKVKQRECNGHVMEKEEESVEGKQSS